MNIAIAQINSRLADIEYNKEQILKQINNLSSQEADVILFPEFALSGSPIYDAVNSADFVDRCYSALEDIALNFKDCPVLIGMPTQGGDDSFSSVVLIEKGGIKSVFSKAMIDSRCEKNFFAGIDSPDFNDEGEEEIDSEIPMNIVTIASRRFLVVIGSDMDYLEQLDKSLNIDGIFSFSSPLYTKDSIEEEFDVLAEAAETFKKPIYRVSAVGGNGVQFINFGGSSVTDSKGKLVAATEPFKEGNIIVESGKGGVKASTVVSGKILNRNSSADDFNALCMAVSGYKDSCPNKKCVVVVDGSVGSGVVAAVAAKSMGKESVLPIIIANNNEDEKQAMQVVTTLGLTALKTVTAAQINSLSQAIKECAVVDSVEQRTVRSIIVQSIASSVDSFIISPISKSDFALGMFKKGSISAPAMLLLADMFRTQICEVAKFINSKKELFSQEAISQYISKEITCGGVTTTYSECDKILSLLIEQGLSILEISGKKHNVDVVSMVAKKVAQSEEKRFCAAPVVKTSQDTFGIDRVMPIAAKL